MPYAPRVAAPALVALAILLLPATATGTSAPPARYAAVDGAGHDCTAAAPCSLAVAVSEASTGDEVIVKSGTYRVDETIEPEAAINLHGAAGSPRPWLVGSDTLLDEVLSAKKGGSLRHLGLKATAVGGDALSLQDGVAEDLLIVSEQGDGGKIVGVPGGTVLRDSVVHASGAGAAGFKLREDQPGGGDVHLVNVTAMAPAGTAVRCDLTGGQATLANTIARGATADVDASHAAPGHCTASTSNVRAAASAGLVSGAGNQEGAPLFVDASTGDYRERNGSPTDDAGAADPQLGTRDPAGCPRTLGVAPDIGAYEHPDAIADACAGAPAEPLLRAPQLPPRAGTDPAGDALSPGGDDPLPPPVLGHSVVIAPPQHGRLRVRTPGSKRFRRVDAATRIPVGTVIDAREGRARLTSALDAHGRVQSGSFWGAKFEVRQRKGARGRVDLFLRGRLDCSATAAQSGATISAARKRPRRSLWGKDRHGRYRTHGQSSAATARGTRWVTTDTCSGTKTRVVEGAVAVRDFAKHRTVLVRAGHSYVARKHG